ncbi:MAG: hypothetical protein V4712_09195 [Pseudomonadota bacterium]
MRYAPIPGVAFVHIPKNAGQSVRNALRAVTPLSYAPLATDLGVTEAEAEDAVERGFPHETLGEIHPAHLTLHLLSGHFPASWAALTTAHSFAMTRAPRARFVSALMQRMKEFGKAGDLRADDPALRSEAAQVCDWLAGRDHFSDLPYIHFTRQTAFTDLNGSRIVSAVFPVDRMDALSHWLTATAGLTIEVTHDHARRQPKPMARLLTPVVRLASRTLLPRPVRRVLHPLWTGSRLFDTAAKGYAKLDFGPEVETFITQYYAADTALHDEAMTAAKIWGQTAPASMGDKSP